MTRAIIEVSVVYKIKRCGNKQNSEKYSKVEEDGTAVHLSTKRSNFSCMDHLPANPNHDDQSLAQGNLYAKNREQIVIHSIQFLLAMVTRTELVRCH